MPKQSPVNSIFGRRLRDARKMAGIPQDRLGVLIGLDEGSSSARMSRYECGVHEPPNAIVLRLAQILGVPAAYFYCEDDMLAEIIRNCVRLTPTQKASVLTFIGRLEHTDN
jgi:transcriptional regulator with XRE-family HTH domain